MPWAATLVIVLLGLGLSLGAAGAVRQRNETVTAERFDALSRHVADQIEDRLARYAYGLRGARGAVTAVGGKTVTRDAFRRYSETREPEREFPGARGFGFIRRVSPDEEPGFVRDARADGFPDFQIRQLAPHRGDRFVIQYIGPVGRNRGAVRLDVASEPGRRNTALAALASGQATLTPPITLVQATGARERGFLIFLPVFLSDLPTATPEERQAAVIGWTCVPLMIDEVLAGLDLRDDGFGFVITDRTEGADIRFFATHDVDAAAEGGLRRVHALTVFGRRWEVEVRDQPEFIAALDRPPPAGIGLAGAAGTLMMAGSPTCSGRSRPACPVSSTPRSTASVCGRGPTPSARPRR